MCQILGGAFYQCQTNAEQNKSSSWYTVVKCRQLSKLDQLNVMAL